MGSFFFLQVIVIVVVLSLFTTIFNKRVLGIPAVMNAFYHNPNENTTGFKGWYQRQCHKMNRKGFKYEVIDNPNGTQTIRVMNVDCLQKDSDSDGNF